MKRNFEHSYGWRIDHLHRLVQSLTLSIVILSHWGHINHSISAILFVICLTIYQLLIFLFSMYLNFLRSEVLLGIVKFIDGIIVGLFIELVSYNSLLGIGIIFSFVTTCINYPPRSVVLCVMGILAANLLARFFTLPALSVAQSVQALIIILMSGFMAVSGIMKNRLHSNLSAKYQSLLSLNNELKLKTFRLSKYLSPVLRKGILAGKDVRVTAQEKPLTIFFSDMQGFSKMSEVLNAEQLTWVINSYLTEMSEIVFRFGGTLDKVIGDSLMVFFGDPDSRGEVNDATACVCMALAMSEAMEGLKQRWMARGIIEPPSLRMGIHSGICKVGNFGTENRLEYTVLGKAVNLASHLESTAKANEIIISQQTFELVKDLVHCVKREPVRVKGFTNSLNAYSAVGIIGDNQKNSNTVSQS